MHTLATSILLIFGISEMFNVKCAPQILDEYMEWTRTGKTSLSKTIFEAGVDLRYQAQAGNFESSPFSEYLSKVASSPQACMSSFRQDMQNQAEDKKNKKYPTYQISDASEESLLTYLIHNEPFPFKDTEMSVRYTFFSGEDGSTGVRWTEAWDECPVQPSRKLSRVQTFRGSLLFSPAFDISSLAVKNAQFDPKKMPIWLVEPMVFKFLKRGLEHIREMTGQ